MLTSFFAKRFDVDVNVLDWNGTEHLLIEKCSYLSVNLIK